MVFIERKIKKGKVYLYLTHKARINGKSKRVWTRYLGPEAMFKDHIENIQLNLTPDFEIATSDFGMPVVLMRLAERLDLINIINECTHKRDQGLSIGQYLLIATLNRCIHPRSKNQLRKWFSSSYLQHLFPTIETYLNSMAYTNHFPYLTEDALERIEQKIIHRLLTEFQVKTDELLYDPTNFYTYIHPTEEQELPKHGHSKEGRHVLNLVSLSIFCTRDGGIPVMHQVYPGNIQDATHFKAEYPRFLNRLQELGLAPTEILLVFDKGNISEEVFQEIDASGMAFIAAVRPSTQKDLEPLRAPEFRRYTLPNGKEVGILEFPRLLYGRERRLLAVYNPRRAHWTAQNLTRKVEAKITEIQEWFQTRLNVKKWRSKEAVEAKINEIIKTKQYFEFISFRVTGDYGQVTYTIELKKDALQQYMETLGKSYLMTNHPTRRLPDLVWAYRQQYTIERAFKYLKHPDFLRITPIYHSKDECIRGHLFTCVLGLLLLTVLTREVQKTFPELELPHIMDLLAEIQLTQIQFSGSRKVIKKLGKMSPEAQKLAELFALDQIL